MDRRQGEPRQSSLPSSLHAHLVTRPPSQEPQLEPGAASETEQFVRRDLRQGRLPEDRNLRLAPIAPIAPPVAPGPSSSGAARRTRETIRGEGGALQREYPERLVRPLPRNRNRERADNRLDLPSPPSTTSANNMMPNIEFSYSSHASPNSGQTPMNYHISTGGLRDRGRSPPRHGVDPNLSLAPLRIDQGFQGLGGDRGNISALLNPPDDHRFPLPSISIGREGFPAPAASMMDRLTYQPRAPSSLNEPRSAGNENQGMIAQRNFSQNVG